MLVGYPWVIHGAIQPVAATDCHDKSVGMVSLVGVRTCLRGNDSVRGI
jgi:hypothetical protein